MKIHPLQLVDYQVLDADVSAQSSHVLLLLDRKGERRAATLLALVDYRFAYAFDLEAIRRDPAKLFLEKVIDSMSVCGGFHPRALRPGAEVLYALSDDSSLLLLEACYAARTLVGSQDQALLARAQGRQHPGRRLLALGLLPAQLLPRPRRADLGGRLRPQRDQQVAGGLSSARRSPSTRSATSPSTTSTTTRTSC